MKSSKGLKALKDIKTTYYDFFTRYDKEQFDIIEEELKEYEGAKSHIEALHKERVENSLKLKALEIIKKRLIDMQDIVLYKTFSSFNQRRTLRGLLPIPKEEYELLKEILL